MNPRENIVNKLIGQRISIDVEDGALIYRNQLEAIMTKEIFEGSSQSFAAIFRNEYPSHLRAEFGDAQLKLIAALPKRRSAFFQDKSSLIYLNRAKESFAQTSGHFYDVVKTIASFVDINKEQKDISTYLIASVSVGNLSMTQALIDSKADVNYQRTEARRTALHHALLLDEKTAPQKIKIIKSLLDAGADPCLSDRAGRMPLLYSYLSTVPIGIEITKLITRKASNPNLISEADRLSPLMVAAIRSDLEKTQFLLSLKAVADNIDLPDKGGLTALMWSISGVWKENSDMVATVKALLEAKANPNAMTNDGFIPLTASVVLPHRSSCIPLLLEFRADINLQNKINGDTALMRSAFRGNFLAARILIENRADLTVKNRANETFIDIINSPDFGKGFEYIPPHKVAETKAEFYKIREELSQQQRPKSPASLQCSSALWPMDMSPDEIESKKKPEPKPLVLGLPTITF